jgi:hypothetical protein
MYDSVTIADIPLSGAELIGCYADGTYENVTAAAQRFPHQVIVPIDTRGTDPKARVLDFEPGDAQNPAAAAQWVKDSRAAGNLWPTVYSDRSQMGELISAFASAGLVLGKDVWQWVATLDGSWQQFEGVTGVAAVQYTQGGNGTYDISVVLIDEWMTSGAPVPGKGLVEGIKFSAFAAVAACNIAWTALPGVKDYTYQCEQELANGTWGNLLTEVTASPYATLTDLGHAQTYRFRVSGGAWSAWTTFKTP